MSDSAVETANKLRLDLFRIAASQALHAAPDTPVAGSAVDLASLLVLTNAMQTAYNLHIANALDPTAGTGIHGQADSGNASLSPAATDLGDCRALLGDIEVQLQKHAGSVGAHLAVSHLTAPYYERAGSLEEAIAHAVALQAQLNLHFASSLNSGVSA